MQTTLAAKISCRGIGLHSGSQVNLSLCPASSDTGIVFRRLDVAPQRAIVFARYDAVSGTRLGTTIENRFGVTVDTIEHLMAALWGAGIDNALIELDGPEVPIMDGSSEPFTFLIECAGTLSLRKARKMLRVVKPVEVAEGKSIVRVEPNREGDEGIVLGIEIEFEHTLIKRQHSHYDFREVTFKQVLSRARTFGFAHEIEALHKAGLALGGSLDNAIVVGKDKILNEEGLRYADEFVRHKALDCLGDLYLAGLRIDGRFNFTRPGHGINNRLLRAVFADESAWVIEEAGHSPEPLFLKASEPVSAYA